MNTGIYVDGQHPDKNGTLLTAIIAILNTSAGDHSKQAALEVVREAYKSQPLTIQHCQFRVATEEKQDAPGPIPPKVTPRKHTKHAPKRSETA